MTEKYLVFRTEKEVEGTGGVCVRGCFELVNTFPGSYPKEDVYDWAEQYSSDHRLQTVVVKGVVSFNGAV